MRLEPIAGKLARWVLRGGSGSNAASLPDWAVPLLRIFAFWSNYLRHHI